MRPAFIDLDQTRACGTSSIRCWFGPRGAGTSASPARSAVPLLALDRVPFNNRSVDLRCCTHAVKSIARAWCNDSALRLIRRKASVRHETTDRARRDKVSGHAAEDPFAEAAVSIGAGHKQIRAFFLGDADQLRSAGTSLLEYDPGAAVDPVPRQITSQVIKMPECGIFLVALASFDDRYARRSLQEEEARRTLPDVPREYPSNRSRHAPLAAYSLRRARPESDDPSSELLRPDRAPCKRLPLPSSAQ